MHDRERPGPSENQATLIPVQLFSFTCTKELFGKSEIFNGDIVFDVVNPFPSKGFAIDK